MSAAFVADVFDYHAGWTDKIAGETLPPFQGGDHMVLTLREPVGVVGAVIPWNAPLTLFAQKVAPALAAGCTIVLKPSEYLHRAQDRPAPVHRRDDVAPAAAGRRAGQNPIVSEASSSVSSHRKPIDGAWSP
jgi:aldehyde dehydrogenase (NAD+)